MNRPLLEALHGELVQRVIDGSWISLACLRHAAPPEPLLLVHEAAAAAADAAEHLERSLGVAEPPPRPGALEMPELDRGYLLEQALSHLAEGAVARTTPPPDRTDAPELAQALLTEGLLRERLGASLLRWLLSGASAAERDAVSSALTEAAGQEPLPGGLERFLAAHARRHGAPLARERWGAVFALAPDSAGR